MARTVWQRIVDGVRQTTSIEGLVGVIVGGGVWAIASGVLAQAGALRIGPAIAVGAGFGLAAVAAFMWFVVRPDRAGQQERTAVLRSSVRQGLVGLSREGHHRDWQEAMEPDVALDAWMRDVESLLLEAFGRDTAERVMRRETTDEIADALDDLWRRVDEIRLRPGYGGWRPSP